MSDIWPGKPYPLGATWDGNGVNFALASEHGEAVDLCLYDPNDPSREIRRVRMPEETDHVFHVYLPGVGPGALYGYRVHGRYAPEEGLRFNAAKLLVDPYAKALHDTITWTDSMFPYTLRDKRQDLAKDGHDSAACLPKSVVVDDAFDWEDDAHPDVPLAESVIYETHVRGMTMQHPDVPEELRGTYAGLACEPVVEYLKDLGVTAVELLPIHQFVSDRFLVDRGLTNYWGYSTLAFFAPDVRYAASGGRGEQVREFKEMVKTFHTHGLEVILDVVYNHTAEGNHLGPMLSFRGIDNPNYYHLVEDHPRYYLDHTGTGNTLRAGHHRVLQLIMDSLRYWITEMHVDGFRFDLASALARELHDWGRLSSFFDTIHQDPVVSRAKLIAEPWDVGPGGYQVGNFPVGWAEWNGKYRDAVRSFWRGDPVGVSELAHRLSGSSDLYETTGRRPYASINFVTAHDGFPLNDLVSYNEKHNEANGENNRDGEEHNLSWNCGVEGPTNDPEITALREKQKRNFLATLLFSQGVPMILGGDEFGRTQFGNNNAYCQDNEISWFDWDYGAKGQALHDFVRRLIRLRKRHPVLRRRKFFHGRTIAPDEMPDIAWFQPDGSPMTEEAWNEGWVRTLGLLLNGKAMLEWDTRGEPIEDDVLLLMINGDWRAHAFQLPGEPDDPPWEVLVDTNTVTKPDAFVAPDDTFELHARTLVLLRRGSAPRDERRRPQAQKASTERSGEAA